MKTLIVDDVQANCRVLKALLTPFGKCEMVSTGREAINAFQTAWKKDEPYQLVCLDIMLPDYDGMQVLEVIRKMEAAMKVEKERHIKAIIISSANEHELRLRARELHSDGYLVKPIYRKDLIEVLRNTGLVEPAQEHPHKPEHDTADESEPAPPPPSPTA